MTRYPFARRHPWLFASLVMAAEFCAIYGVIAWAAGRCV